MLVEYGLFCKLRLSSRKVYASTITTYLRWADEVGCKDPWPLTETRAALFAAWRIRVGGCQVSTVRGNMSHLQDFHTTLGMDCWDWNAQPRLKGMFHGWAVAVAAPQPTERQPWLFEYFVLWHNNLPVVHNHLISVSTWTASLVAFWSLARGSEVLSNSAAKPDRFRTLQWDQVEVFDTHAVIHLTTSKNDRYHQGADLLLPRLDDHRFCPVFWLARMAKLQHRYRNKRNWVFITNHDTPLAMQEFRREFRNTIRLLGLDPSKFNTHSFRIGGATELFRRGVSVDVIKKLGRWKGDTFEMYTRPAADICATWASSILSRPVLSALDGITFLFGDEWTHRRRR